MKKVIAILLVIGAAFWAKKRFTDQPAPPAKSETEVAAEKIGGTVAAARAVQSTSSTSSVTSSPSERSLSAVLSSFVHGQSATPETKAKARLTAFMASWKEGGTSLNDAAQAAACYWSRGVKFIPDRDEIRDAADGFDRWRRDNSLYTDINSYAVGEAVQRGNDPARGGDYTVVEVAINNAIYRIGVPDKANPLFMAP